MFELRPILEKAVIKSGIKPSHRLHMLLWYLELGSWLKKNPCSVHLDSRESLFRMIQETSIGDGAVTYLEFGVARGATLRYWTELNQHPQSRFYGFDSFTGLPEEWKTFTIRYPAGSFSMEGQLPTIDDSRVQLIPGFFQETLANFINDFRAKGTLVVHCDADLYSSTLFVLTTLHPILRAGSVVLFDDFTTANHDFRAFYDYTSAYRRNYSLIGLAKPSVRKTAIRFD